MTSTRSQKNTDSKDLSRTYSEQIATLKSVFEDWTEMDLIALLEEVQGDLETAINRITSGEAQQWGEVKGKKKDKKKETPVRYDAPTRGSSTRGGRGGSRGGRGGRGGHRNSDRTSYAHGGEKSANTVANGHSSNEPVIDNWSASHPDEPIASSGWDQPVKAADDWNPTVTKSSSKDWSELEEKTEKLAITEKTSAKKSITVVKPNKKNNASPNKSGMTGWAQIVKGPEPVPEPKSTQAVKKFNVIKPNKPQEPVPPPAEPVQEPIPSSPVKSPVRSPSPQLQKSPVQKPVASPPKNVVPFKAFEEPTASPAQKDTQLPPGLNQNRQNAPQRKLKQDAAVVMPSMPIQNTPGVQFGSFGTSKITESETKTTVSRSPERSEESAPHFQFNANQNSRPVAADVTAAPGLAAHMSHYPPQFPMNGVGAMDYPYEHDHHRIPMGGYYAPDATGYGVNTKYANDVNSSNAHSPAQQLTSEAHHPQQYQHQQYQYYQQGYYPFQQPYQQHHYAQQQFHKPAYFPSQPTNVPSPSLGGSSTAASGQKASPAGGLTAGSAIPTGVPHQASYGYQQPLYGSGYDDFGMNDYGKSYGVQQNFQPFSPASLGNQPKGTDFKAQTRNGSANGRQYEKQGTGSNAQQAPNGYYPGQQFSAGHYQQPMMPQTYPQGFQSGNQRQPQQYWNGNGGQ
ncbi:RNAPII degradation factor [Globomyces sp. JEL0801]|nr:RNAPII degradation factor [Globomyces sp. JEL0801]